MKRSFLFLLLLCLLLFTAASVAQADDPVFIKPYVGGPEYYVSAGQEVIIQAGWAACTRGLTVAFERASSVAMEVQYGGTPYLTVYPPSREYWAGVEPTTEGDPDACVMNTDTLWRTWWYYSLGELAVGVYDVHFLWTTSHPLPDGGDYDGDGRPDFVGGEPFHLERDFTITVN